MFHQVSLYSSTPLVMCVCVCVHVCVCVCVCACVCVCMCVCVCGCIDIMPSVNDVLCILIIPLLDYLVYPHIESSMKIKLLHLHKVHIHHIVQCFMLGFFSWLQEWCVLH